MSNKPLPDYPDNLRLAAEECAEERNASLYHGFTGRALKIADKERLPPDSTKTIVIHHGVSVTPDAIFGAPVPFPPGDILSPALVRRVELALVAFQVEKFEDGMWHATVHPFGAYDILSGVSASQAADLGVRRVEGKRSAHVVAFGIRWEQDTAFREARVYGPHSDPNNVLLIDLTERKRFCGHGNT
jgi:hypothetical protein